MMSDHLEEKSSNVDNKLKNAPQLENAVMHYVKNWQSAFSSATTIMPGASHFAKDGK